MYKYVSICIKNIVVGFTVVCVSLCIVGFLWFGLDWMPCSLIVGCIRVVVPGW